MAIDRLMADLGRPRGPSVAGLAAALVIGMAGLGRAAEPPPSMAPAVQAVLSCRAIKEDAARLTCFDKATAAMGEAETKGDLLTLDRQQRQAVRKQAFGLTLPALNLFDKGEKPAEADRITATVASASQDPYGKWTIRLDDGAVWRQTDSNELFRPPHKGSTVVIKKGVLGSFFIDVDGQPSIRAHRDA
jgi:hypothetical protein